MNPSHLPRLVKSSDQVNLLPDHGGKDYLPLRMPSSPVWEAGGPAAVSAGLSEESGCWGGRRVFLLFLAVFFKKRFIGAVCRSEHVGDCGSELKIQTIIISNILKYSSFKGSGEALPIVEAPRLFGPVRPASHHPRLCQSWKAGGGFSVLKSEASKNHTPETSSPKILGLPLWL